MWDIFQKTTKNNKKDDVIINDNINIIGFIKLKNGTIAPAYLKSNIINYLSIYAKKGELNNLYESQWENNDNIIIVDDTGFEKSTTFINNHAANEQHHVANDSFLVQKEIDTLFKVLNELENE